MYNGINNGETEKKNLIVKHMDDDDKEKNNNILINSTKFKLGNESKNNDIFLHDDNNDHLNKNNNANSDIEDINNKTNSYFPLNKIILVNNKKDKKHNLFLKSNKRKKRIYNLDSEKEDDDEVEDYEQFLNIKVFYEGKGLSLKVSKDDKFGNCLSKIQKMLFPFYKLSDYNILYKLKVLDTKSLHEEKIKNIIKENDSCVTFYLKKKVKNLSKNNKETTVLIENFPSFTDLATELNKFFEKEKRESNFNVNFKGTICKVSFSESEKAFSLVIYLTKLKKVNPIYKRLKINMDYKLNVVLDIKKLRKEPVKLILPYISKNPKDKNNKSNKNKSLPNKKKLAIKIENNSKSNNYNIYKSRNDNLYKNNTLETKQEKRYESYDNNEKNCNILQIKPKRKYESFSSFKAITKPKRYESCLSIGQNIILNSESKLFKNQFNTIDNPLINSQNYSKKHKYEKFLSPAYDHLKTNNNPDDSDKIINKMSKIKSTNFIVNLNKNKKKKRGRVSLFNKNNNKDHSDDEDDDNKSFSSEDN
jgi:hypothetical protein